MRALPVSHRTPLASPTDTRAIQRLARKAIPPLFSPVIFRSPTFLGRRGTILPRRFVSAARSLRSALALPILELFRLLAIAGREDYPGRMLTCPGGYAQSRVADRSLALVVP